MGKSKSVVVSVNLQMTDEDEKRLTGLAKKNGKSLKQYLAEELELNFRLSAAGARVEDNLRHSKGLSVSQARGLDDITERMGGEAWQRKRQRKP